MKATQYKIPGLLQVEYRVWRDDRGFFCERFKKSGFETMGIRETFVQDNHSRSAPGVLRGLHYQTDPQQGKFVYVARGRILDVALDLRKGSPTFGQAAAIELSDANGMALWIPYGFAHGFCVLGNEEADVVYKVTGEYNPATDVGVRWNDPCVASIWPIADPLVSEKDKKLPFVKDVQPL